MTLVAKQVLSTVNASYGTSLTAEQLALKVADPLSADRYDPSAFSFFSDVDENLQYSFLNEMAVDTAVACKVARKFAALAGYELPLARVA